MYYYYKDGEIKMEEQFQTEIYLSGNHLMIRAGYSDPEIHSHKAAHLILSCKESFKVEAKGVSETKGVLIPSGCPHTIRSRGEDLLVFMFDDTTRIAESIDEVRILPEEVAEKGIALYEKLLKPSLAEPEKVAAYREFFTGITELCGLGTPESRIRDPRILSALSYVEEHISEELTEEEISREVCLSVSRFSHLFRQEAGISFAGYVILRRMYRAYILLSTGMSITEASLESGFSTPSHFAALNKKIFGINAGSISGSLKIYEVTD